MPAYKKANLVEFVHTSASEIIGQLQYGYANDGFLSQYTRQTKAWARVIPDLQQSFAVLLESRPEASDWSILLEYPLYRLRRRIDIVILVGDVIVLVECKVGAETFSTEDARQVEEYALDLRDFHAQSYKRSIVPILWSTHANDDPSIDILSAPVFGNVAPIVYIGREGLNPFLSRLNVLSSDSVLILDEWDRSHYKPVPNVIDAATSIFAGHDVRSIANADADNLEVAASRLLDLIGQAHREQARYLLLLTGVPGSGKTLAGLDVVHSAIATGVEHEGDIVYLSGNTPLVVVLREALARDEYRRGISSGNRKKIGDVRRQVRTRIQHINDFLQESLRGSTILPPHEHVIVFDEAQRAWDEKHGFEKFERSASEPALLLELMSRHEDWCVCICLIGSGQEINSGEDGVRGWGDALRKMGERERQRWSVFGPASAFGTGRPSTASTLGDLPPGIFTNHEPALELLVPQRSFRSPDLSLWVEHVLAGDHTAANQTMQQLNSYPILLTRSLAEAKAWLKRCGRGERSYGLIASSGARRLRAEGIGITLNASAGEEIAQWYLNPRGDIRSSYALEVAANEYTCQGLELDFTCICWGGDLTWNDQSNSWMMARLSGTQWQKVRVEDAKRFLLNSYRVLLTRAREGLLLWVPEGDASDHTRTPGPLNDTAEFLKRCGVIVLTPDRPSRP
jgi:Uncharacterized conserved protein (DUF2075)